MTIWYILTVDVVGAGAYGAAFGVVLSGGAPWYLALSAFVSWAVASLCVRLAARATPRAGAGGEG